MTATARPAVILPRLHLVTDDEVLSAASFAQRAERALEAGGAGVALHLRGHAQAGGCLFALAERLAPAARAAGALLLANDRVDVALCAALDGVELGRRSIPVADARALVGPERRIGYSAHALPEALEAVGEGADFLVMGTVYATPSHTGLEPAGPELVAEAARLAPVPVLGIGGVTPERAAALARRGAHGVAVVRGVWGAEDPAAAVREYLDALGSEA